MASPRNYNIYIREGQGNSLEWSYFDSTDDNYWNPLTNTSPNLLLKRQDTVNWIATGDIDDAEIDFIRQQLGKVEIIKHIDINESIKHFKDFSAMIKQQEDHCENLDK